VRRRALIWLVFIVAGAVGAESWHAAKNAAETGGRPWPWLWPVTLEAFIAVLVLVYWDARSAGRRAPGARFLLALTTAVASGVQALDAPPTWLGWLTAAWTPVALLLTVEFATWLLYGAPAPVPDEADEPVVPLGPEPVPTVEPATVPTVAPTVPAGTVPPRSLTPADRQALRRVHGDPEAVTRIVAKRGLDRGTVDATVAGWARSNGHRPTVKQHGGA